MCSGVSGQMTVLVLQFTVFFLHRQGYNIAEKVSITRYRLAAFTFPIPQR